MNVMNLDATDTPEDTEDQWCPCFTKKVVKPRFSKGNNMSKIRLEQVRDAQMDVRTLTDLKDSFEDRLSELQFQLGQNDIYEQMIDQGIIPEGDKE